MTSPNRTENIGGEQPTTIVAIQAAIRYGHSCLLSFKILNVEISFAGSASRSSYAIYNFVLLCKIHAHIVSSEKLNVARFNLLFFLKSNLLCRV